ncbi:MAG: hypothetical protein A2Y23_10150 [Clostridiales bacterium GWB2_37_7]|nr:MAG: hypothetical protein A2Y23_10150 [Clostridiales bacterium GWB2_37_7]
MPNNLVFNNSAQELKVQIYGITSGAAVTGLLVDNSGNMQVGGSVTATIANTVTVTANSFDIRALASATDTVSVTGSVTATIANTVTVTGQVTVTANDFNIRSLASATDTVSVTGSVTATIANTVTVTGQVTVTANAFDIRALASATDTVSVTGSVSATIANTVTVSLGGHGFTTSTLTISTADAALTNTAFQFDTSQYKDYSFYIVNTGTAAVSVRLQISPTTTQTFFMNDNTPEISLAQDAQTVLVPGLFLNYTRIQVTGAQTITAIAYFNGQN